MDPTDGLFNQCSITPSSAAPLWTPYFIAFATIGGTQYAYISDVQGSANEGLYRRILASNDAGGLSNCQLTPTSPLSSWAPIGIAFRY